MKGASQKAKEVLEAADWSSETTFTKLYLNHVNLIFSNGCCQIWYLKSLRNKLILGAHHARQEIQSMGTPSTKDV